MTKILSNRLASFVGDYIHRNQVGFIPGRQGSYQVRRAVNVISLLNSGWDRGPSQEGFLLSIDLQKTFDTVTWPYLFTILEKWGIGTSFPNILKDLYSLPKAQVKIQGHLSDPLPITQGTRQGCPLSSLLLAIAIETLAIAIRGNPPR